jgi:aspartokinase
MAYRWTSVSDKKSLISLVCTLMSLMVAAAHTILRQLSEVALNLKMIESDSRGRGAQAAQREVEIWTWVLQPDAQPHFMGLHRRARPQFGGKPNHRVSES